MPRASLTHYRDESLQSSVFGGQGVSHPTDSDVFGHSMSNIDPASISLYQFGSDSGGHTSVSGNLDGLQAVISFQSDLVSKHSNVSQQYWQITPPDDPKPSKTDPASTSIPETQQLQEDIAKLNRAQRARNAANKRHSKSKKRKDSLMGEIKEEGGEDDDQSKTTRVQREKNRIAAAKCRAKKKATSEEMQDVQREGARAHTYLSREVRGLRDQHAFLRNLLLLHEPGVCQCDAIHRFNMAKRSKWPWGLAV